MIPLLLALVSAGLLLLSYPKFGYYPLAWGALVPLMILCELPAQEAAKYALLSGTVFFTGLLYWLIHVLNYYGFVPLPGALGLIGLLSLYLGGYFAIWSLALSYLQRRLTGWYLIFYPFLSAALFVGLEYLREKALSGFPWGSLWASQAPWPAITVSSRLTGPWGITFLIVSTNAAFYLLLRRGFKPPALVGAFLGLLLPILALGYGQTKLKAPVEFLGLKVGIIQANISQDKKWDPAFQRETLRIYENLSKQAVQKGAQLIIWPETATPFIFHPEEGLGKEVLSIAKQLDVYLLFGAPIATLGPEGLSYHNSAFLVSPEGKIIDRYDKQHLVPFGEYVPGGGRIPFLRKLVGPSGDYRPGPLDHPLAWSGPRMGVLICFEAIFPELARREALRGAKVLINLTNDAWFGRSAGPWQHFALARIRTAETGLPLIRVANTGISGLIDPYGRILSRGPLEESWYQIVNLPSPQPATIYLQLGPLLPRTCLAMVMIVLGLLALEAIGLKGLSKRLE